MSSRLQLHTGAPPVLLPVLWSSCGVSSVFLECFGVFHVVFKCVSVPFSSLSNCGGPIWPHAASPK